MAERARRLKCRLCIDSITRRDFTPGDHLPNLRPRHEDGPEQLITGALESLTSAHRLRGHDLDPKENLHVPSRHPLRLDRSDRGRRRSGFRRPVPGRSGPRQPARRPPDRARSRSPTTSSAASTFGAEIGVAGRDLRLRRLVVQPGGIVPFHSHAGRPALIITVSGDITEYRSTCAVPIDPPRRRRRPRGRRHQPIIGSTTATSPPCCCRPTSRPATDFRTPADACAPPTSATRAALRLAPCGAPHPLS